MKKVKVRKIGNALGTILPKKLLDELNVQEGDELHVVRTSSGIVLTPYDPSFEKMMESFHYVCRNYRNALKELANGE